MRTIPFLAILLCAASVAGQLKKSVTLMQASSALLTQSTVQRHLKLNTKQVASLNATFKWFEEQGSAVQRTVKDRNAGMAKIEALQLQAVDRALAALNPTQKLRLKQLGLQMYGPFAVLSPEVAKEIGLSPDQRKKIEALQVQSVQKAGSLIQERAAAAQTVPRPKDPNDRAQVAAYQEKLSKVLSARNGSDQKRADDLKRQSDAKVLSFLTAGQRAQWSRMLGPKFPIPGRRA